MSSPIEKYKEQLKKYIEAREKATSGEWKKCLVRWVDSEFMLDNGEMQKVTTSGIVPECDNSKFACLAANESAQIAQQLLDAVEALEFYADKENWDTDHMTPTIWDNGAVDLGNAARETLEKLSKGAE